MDLPKEHPGDASRDRDSEGTDKKKEFSILGNFSQDTKGLFSDAGLTAREAVQTALKAAERAEAASRKVEAAAETVAEKFEELRQVSQGLKALREEIQQGLGAPQEFSADEMRNLNIIKVRVQESFDKAGQAASAAAEDFRAAAREDLAQEAYEIKVDASHWRSQAETILSIGDERLRLRISISAAHAMQVRREWAEEKVQKLEKSSTEGSDPAGKMRQLWARLTECLRQWWEFVRNLMTPKEWKLNGTVGDIAFLGIGSAGLEITFGR